MRRTSTLTVPVGYGKHDHACWFHAGREQWREVLVPFLGEGLVRGERLLYLADRNEDRLAADLVGLPERDELLRTGQLVLSPMAPARGVVGGPLVTAQVAAITQATEDALASGYRGLRLAVDAVHPVRGGDDVRRFVRSEMVIDELAAWLPLVLLCGYDGRFVERSAARALSFVHPLRQRAVFDRGSGLYADITDSAEDPDAAPSAGNDDESHWRLSGELDLASREVLRIALDAVPVRGDLHLWLGDLRFVDVGGAHALAALAERIAPRRLLLHDPPTVLSRIVELSQDAFPALRRVAPV